MAATRRVIRGLFKVVATLGLAWRGVVRPDKTRQGFSHLRR